MDILGDTRVTQQSVLPADHESKNDVNRPVMHSGLSKDSLICGSQTRASAGTVPYSRTAMNTAGAACLLLLFASLAYFVRQVTRTVRLVWRQQSVLKQQGITQQPDISIVGAQDPAKKDQHRTGLKWTDNPEGMYFFRIAFYNILTISNPYLAAEILDRRRFPDFDKPTDTVFYGILDQATADPPTPSLLSTAQADPYWKVVRKGTAAAFNPQNLRTGAEVVSRMANRLVKILKGNMSNDPIDMDVVMQHLTLDVIGMFGYKKDFGATEDLCGYGAHVCFLMKEAACVAFERITNPLKGIPFTKFWFRAEDLKRRLVKAMRDGFEEVLSRGKPTSGDQTIAGHLLRTCDEHGRPLPFLRLWSEFSIFYIAGMETTGHTMAWVLFQLSQHPEVEAKVVEELDRLGLLATPERCNPRHVEYADIAQLTYLSCVIRETMRTLPVVPIIMRKANKDVTVGGYKIAEGTHIAIHVMAMNNSSRYWDRADEFLPERWLDPECEYALLPASKGNNGSIKEADHPQVNGFAASSHQSTKVKRFIPYGEGSRQCIGMGLAKVNVAGSLATLLSHFSFRLADEMGGPEGVRRDECFRISLQPGKGMLMHCIPRVRQS